ncbi:ABC transporter substrate-binding protein [Cryobacterium sp. TMS1-20-1]|uniref:ABC transporter substrate-binding protein n=1 Tax=Cryobacterium sp. TMS1-20-1 TaxID=1259223 RepID=UPI00141B96F0|nr:ABC transporter substrate-binding protein [Cryobacterium sp. TMS1-20-1]
MKRQRKVATLIAFGATMALTAVGCASNAGVGDDSESQSTSINVAAQAWMIEKFHMNDMVDNFEAANESTTVNIVEYPDNQSLSNFALQWSQGKSSQDVVVVDGSSVAVQFLAKDLIIDFNETDFFEGPTAKENFVGESLVFNELDGVQFAIPIGLETYNISANKSYFEEAGLLGADGEIPAPETWEDLYDMAAAMTVKDGNTVTRPGMTIQWGPNAVSTMIAVEQAVRGSFYEDDILTFDTPEMREVLEIWKRGVTEGVFSIDTFSNKDAGRSNFNAGNIPMVLETAAHVPEAIPTIGEENSVVLAMPGSAENGSYGFTAGVLVPSASTNQDLALQFIQEAMMSDVQVAFGEEWGKLPVITEHFDKIEAPWKTSMYDLVKISEPAPMYRDLPEIQVTGKQMLQEYLTGSRDLDTFITDLEKLIEDANKSAE